MTRSWTKGLALSSLASAALLGVACGESNSSSGGQGHVSDAATDVGTPDAPPSEDAPTSDAPDAACSGGGDPDIGPLNLTFDQEIAYLCSESDASALGLLEVSRGTMECDGLLAVAWHHGVDAMDFYLFDPTTRELVEALACNNCDGFTPGSWCVTSATGIDLTKSPAFSGCWAGGFGFQVVCPDGAPAGPSDSGPPDAASNAASDASPD